ncbi:MAG: ABC transporter ATP-binding protein [Actinomycetota bacterium]
MEISSPAVRFSQVTKRYAGGGGVEDLTFDVAQGEVFGFLGPNGAGKSTSIRLMLDLIRPNSGSLSIFGLDAQRDSLAVRRRTGYLPGDLAFDPRLTGHEVLHTVAALRGLSAPSCYEALAVRLRADLDRPTGSLSKGGRQKVGLVAALMGDPDLLVLDEPTTGLDPLVQQQVHREVRRAASEGRTVFLSSHVLAEVGEMADRIGFIRDGKLVSVDPLEEFRLAQLHRIDVTTAKPLDPTPLLLPGVRLIEQHELTVSLEIRGPLQAILAALSQLDLVDCAIRTPSIEDEFLEFYGEPNA